MNTKNDFGYETRRGLCGARVLVALCTSAYGEKTAGTYETYEELLYAREHPDEMTIVPVQLCRVWPPEPPGPQEGRDLCDFVFRSCKVAINGVVPSEDGTLFYMDAENLACQIYGHIEGLKLLESVSYSDGGQSPNQDFFNLPGVHENAGLPHSSGQRPLKLPCAGKGSFTASRTCIPVTPAADLPLALPTVISDVAGKQRYKPELVWRHGDVGLFSSTSCLQGTVALREGAPLLPPGDSSKATWRTTIVCCESLLHALGKKALLFCEW